MGGGIGFVRDAMERMAQNRANLKKKSVYKDFVDYGSGEKKVYKYKKASPELLDSIRESKIHENDRLRKRNWILIAICTAISIIGLWQIFIL